jgi:segregation and condensation protein B
MEENNQKFKELEALLFTYGEPLNIKNIAKFLDIKKDACEEIIKIYEEMLKNNPSGGLMILRNADEIQLVTKPELQKIGEKIIQEEFKEELSPAGLETLSIIAYLGPIPRATIDYIRGVNSSYTLRNLLMRGLIQRSVNSHKGNIYEYLISFDFLKHIGLNKPQELPEFEKYKDVLERFEISNF